MRKKYEQFYSVTDEKFNKDEFEKMVSGENRLITKGIEVGHIFYFGDKYSKAFLLLQEARDASHRFAILAQRKKKRRSINKSKLDEIDGIGAVIKKRLLSKYKSIKMIKTVNIDDLMTVKGINAKIARFYAFGSHLQL